VTDYIATVLDEREDQIYVKVNILVSCYRL